jgi:hypothetical protein
MLAEPFIYQMELIDIHNDRIHRHIPVMLVKQLHIVHEIVNVVQFGQSISLSGLDDAAPF